MAEKIQWNEQNKIRVSEADVSKQKYLIVKTLIMLHLKIKYEKYSHWIKLYSDFPAVGEKICDVYYENIKTRKACAYEIEENVTKERARKIEKTYRDWEVYGINKTDYVIVDINKLSNDIDSLGLQIKKLII